MNKMKSRNIVLVFGVAVFLILMQLSCAGVKDAGIEEAAGLEEAPAVVAAAEEDSELAGIHKSAGISCGDCHAESPPADAVLEATCLTCHDDYKELTAGTYEDPHNAHMAFRDCGDCHHVHRPSENQCLACHAF
jgi:fumarate reductase flavoprotein subunit